MVPCFHQGGFLSAFFNGVVFLSLPPSDGTSKRLLCVLRLGIGSGYNAYIVEVKTTTLKYKGRTIFSFWYIRAGCLPAVVGVIGLP